MFLVPNENQKFQIRTSGVNVLGSWLTGFITSSTDGSSGTQLPDDDDDEGGGGGAVVPTSFTVLSFSLSLFPCGLHNLDGTSEYLKADHRATPAFFFSSSSASSCFEVKACVCLLLVCKLEIKTADAHICALTYVSLNSKWKFIKSFVRRNLQSFIILIRSRNGKILLILDRIYPFRKFTNLCTK